MYQKFKRLPEIRLLEELAQTDVDTIPDLLCRNLISFLGSHLKTRGTRHAEDQNIFEAVLTMIVDAEMVEDEFIKGVSDFLGVLWHAVKKAAIRRIKLDDEQAPERTDGVFTREPRA